VDGGGVSLPNGRPPRVEKTWHLRPVTINNHHIFFTILGLSSPIVLFYEKQVLPPSDRMSQIYLNLDVSRHNLAYRYH
jgi:hypothetical protein